MSGGIFWLASYPKSGNTWFRAFLQNVREDREEPVRINELHTGAIASARGWLDGVLGFDTADLSPEEVDALRPRVYDWSAAAETESPFYHKTHDAWTYLRNGEPLLSRSATRGVLYLVRNPLDVAISYANHNSSTIDEAITVMANPEHALCPSRRALDGQVRQWLLSWSAHVASYLDAPDLNVELLRYEDMRKRSQESFLRAARFLQLTDDADKVNKALDFCRMDRLKQQEAEAPFKERPPKMETFFRKGITGDWQDTLSAEQIQRIIKHHGPMMQRLGYLDDNLQPTPLIHKENNP